MNSSLHIDEKVGNTFIKQKCLRLIRKLSDYGTLILKYYWNLIKHANLSCGVSQISKVIFRM